MPQGSCLCGMVAYFIDLPPSKVITCFCSDCRKSSGHLGQINGAFQTEDVRWHDTNNFLKRYTSTDTQSKHPKVKLFCGNCGCTMGTIPGLLGGDVTNLRITLVDEFKKEYYPEGKHFVESEMDYMNGNFPSDNFV